MTRPIAKPLTNAQWSEQTTRELTLYARREFAQYGYEAASVERIADDAGLTKGAVYYHFRSKKGLFEAVLRAAHAEIVERIETRADASSDPVAAVVAGCQAFLDVALDDALRRITLADGPRVLGWARWRAIDSEYGLGSLKEGLAACQAAGLLTTSEPDTLAHFISGALNEAVFLVAEAADREAIRATITRSLDTFLRRVIV